MFYQFRTGVRRRRRRMREDGGGVRRERREAIQTGVVLCPTGMCC